MQVDEGVAAGMRLMGFGEDAIASARAERQTGADAPGAEDDFEVHEDCWESWKFYLTVQRQWVYVAVSAGLGVTNVRRSLDWSGIRAVVLLKRIAPKRWEQLVDDLLVVEGAVLQVELERNNKG